MQECGMMIITGCIIVLGIYELMSVFWKDKPGYLSTIMQRAGFKAPFVVFAIGFLCCHWWGYFPPTVEDANVICPHCKCEIRLTVDDTGIVTLTLNE